MSNIIRTKLPLTIISVMLLIIFLDYFFVLPSDVSTFVSGMQKWIVILAAFALVLGALNVIKIHSPKVLTNKILSDRFLSLWLLSIMVVTILVGLILNTTSSQYSFIFTNVLSPISTSVWSIMAFYYCGAVIRTFRAKSLEALILVVAAFLVVSKNAPAINPILPGYEALGQWIVDVPAVSAMRGMIIGVGIGVVFTGVRMLLQIERRSTVGE